MENTIALALWRELQLLEDNTGSRVGLQYLRDRDGNEVDFLALVDGRAILMAEGKVGDDTFAKSLWHFGRYFPRTSKTQGVLELKRPKEKDGVSMVPAHDFLSTLVLS